MNMPKRDRSGRACPDKSDQRPQAWTTAAAKDNTHLLNDDNIKMVATFATCQDLCIIGQVCRRLAPLPFHDDLWELRALDILHSVTYVRSAMALLKLTSCRQLVETFTRIGIPGGVLGFWQAEAPTLSWAAQLQHSARQQEGGDGRTVEELDARGELLRITLEAGGFLCESIAPNGTSRRIFTIRVSKTPTDRIKIGFFSLEKESSLTIGGDDDSWVPGDSMAEAITRYTLAVPGCTSRTPIRTAGVKAFFLEREDGRTCRYVKLTASPQASSASSTTVAATGGVENLCGLWCAPYGNHGLEIIQLSTHLPCSRFEEAAAAEAAAVEAATAERSCSFSRPWSGEGRGSSCSGCSTGRMTDGTESVGTSAPATDADGSETGSCSGSDGCGGGFDTAAGADDDSGGDGDADCAVVDGGLTMTFTRRRESLRHDRDVARHQSAASTTASAAGPPSAHGNRTPASSGGNLPPQLFGFKVTGDNNVPAGKMSFVIDLLTEFDVDEELRFDSRPVVMFLPTGAVMANLANRRQRISCWRKGRGQINRVPGRWSPEWVDVDFVEYRIGSRCAFSVIFRQPTQAVRAVMDFERALACEEEWPRWPDTTACAPWTDSSLAPGSEP